MEGSPLVWLALCLFGITTLFVLRMAIDCIRNEEGTAKFLWLALLIIGHIAAAILYLIVRYLPRVRAQQAASGGSGGSSSYGGGSKKRKRAPHKKPKQRGPG